MEPNDSNAVALALANNLPAIILAIGTALASISGLILGVLAHIRQKRQDALNAQVKAKTNALIDTADALRSHQIEEFQAQAAVATAKTKGSQIGIDHNFRVTPEVRVPQVPEKFDE